MEKEKSKKTRKMYTDEFKKQVGYTSSDACGL
jgi:uncharacterized protein YnzC (UPF0291/DUF896 family)